MKRIFFIVFALMILTACSNTKTEMVEIATKQHVLTAVPTKSPTPAPEFTQPATSTPLPTVKITPKPTAVSTLVPTESPITVPTTIATSQPVILNADFCIAVTEIPQGECAALVAIWEQMSNEKDKQLSPSPCTWEEVQCTDGHVTGLNLVEKSTNSLPPEIGDFPCLTDLYLWDNGLSRLPPEIGNLTNLKSLTLGGFVVASNVESLPPEFGNLTNLTELNLKYNKLIQRYNFITQSTIAGT